MNTVDKLEQSQGRKIEVRFLHAVSVEADRRFTLETCNAVAKCFVAGKFVLSISPERETAHATLKPFHFLHDNPFLSALSRSLYRRDS